MLRFVVRTFLRSSNTSTAISVPFTTLSRCPVSTVSYLTKVWGLTLEQAKSAAKSVTVEDTESADSVFELLKSYRFSNSDVVRLICKQPGYIVADAEKDLRPKMEYLMSLGISGSHLLSILCSNKGILSSQLRNIIPMLDFFKEFLKSEKDLVSVIRNSSRVLSRVPKHSISRYVVPNIQTLQAHGVPYQVIVRLLAWNAQALCLKTARFEEVVKTLEDMGFEPEKVFFILGLNSIGLTSQLVWDKKRDLFTKLGWSEEVFVSAFRKQPLLMVCSKVKIMEVSDFLINKVGFTPLDIAMYPVLFLHSLKKRMVPRFSVLQVLMSNGKLKKQAATVFTAMKKTDSQFLERYVTAYEKDVPDVVKAYQGQLEIEGFKAECDMKRRDEIQETVIV